jgi:hypothetical protein
MAPPVVQADMSGALLSHWTTILPPTISPQSNRRGVEGASRNRFRPVRQFKLDSSIRPGFLRKTPPKQRLRYLRFVGGFAD